MLKTIDILLGVTVVMLVASMAVTVLTQFITGLANTRGRHLLRGLGDLLQQIDPNLERDIADQISGAILTHPMISHVGQRYGAVIHREEFTKLLMDLAAGQVPGKDGDRLAGDAKLRLKKLLEENEVPDPAKTLDKVRSVALQLELSNPNLATHARHGIALMREADSKLLAKINGWFDQTIDRVSDRFTASTRIITVVCSFLLVAVIQLDSIDLINRLSVDPELRNSLVQQAVQMEAKADQAAENLGKFTGQQKEDIKSLLQLGVISIPKSPSEWWGNWCKVSLSGLVLSVFLLSLGAPFWYSALKDLLKLRGTLANKDDEQRKERQTTQPGPGTSPGAGDG